MELQSQQKDFRKREALRQKKSDAVSGQPTGTHLFAFVRKKDDFYLDE
jgi:hypothetical protein